MTLNASRGTGMPKPRSGREQERGQIIILFVFVLIVIMGAAAMVVDVGVLRNANQNLWNALDAGALAGASQLPADATNASAIALQYADDNYPGGLPAGVTVGFRCVVGSSGGAPRAADLPVVCDPGGNAVWTCNSTTCSSVCIPAEGDSCNTIVLEQAATVPYNFGPAVGVTTGTTQTVLSAACKGPCGAKLSGPVDLVLIVDRTPSMDAGDLANARRAADDLRKSLNPTEQWVAYGMIGPSTGTGSCPSDAAASLGTANLPSDLRRWIPIGMSGIGAPIHNESYTSSGTALANAISCFGASPGGVATDLADPFPAAAYELAQNGRAGVPKGIIFMTDGQPNNSVVKGGGPCGAGTSAQYDAEALARANAAKTAIAGGIEIFTIGFGLGPGEIHGSCGSPPGWSTTGQETRARQLLAGMATGPSADDGCTPAENDDGDHFFCVPKGGGSADLSKVFKQAANALIGGTKLIRLP